MAASADIIAAIATPPGRGGIGVVRISGGAVDAIIDGVVGRKLRPRHAQLATFLGGRGEAIDRGIVILFPAPASYTGESSISTE